MPNYTVLLLVVAIVAILIGGGAGLLIARGTLRKRQKLELSEAEARFRERSTEINSQTKEQLLEAKEEAVRIRTAAEQEARDTRAQAQQYERRLYQKEENLERRVGDLERREQEIVTQEKSLEDLREQLENANREQSRELERVANMTRQEAQGILMGQVEQDLRNEVARKVREAELQARDESEKRSRRIVTETIQRIAADQTRRRRSRCCHCPTRRSRVASSAGRAATSVPSSRRPASI